MKEVVVQWSCARWGHVNVQQDITYNEASRVNCPMVDGIEPVNSMLNKRLHGDNSLSRTKHKSRFRERTAQWHCLHYTSIPSQDNPRLHRIADTRKCPCILFEQTKKKRTKNIRCELFWMNWKGISYQEHRKRSWERCVALDATVVPSHDATNKWSTTQIESSSTSFLFLFWKSKSRSENQSILTNGEWSKKKNDLKVWVEGLTGVHSDDTQTNLQCTFSKSPYSYSVQFGDRGLA